MSYQYVITSESSIKENGRGRILFWTSNFKIKELGEHGDLVDRDDILQCFEENQLSAKDAVMKAPVILEASE